MNIYETPKMEVVFFNIEEVDCLYVSQNAQFGEGESGSINDWLLTE